MRESSSGYVSFVRIRAIRATAACAIVLLLTACGGGGGGSAPAPAPAPPPPAFTDPTLYSVGPSASLPNAAELSSVTRHQLPLGGATINYTATAGHLTASSLAGRPEASFFYVAYTQDGADPATRPVTFFYNGGPGSATVWLHLGSFGPKRLVTGDPATTAPVPFPLVDNAESLLDVSDLVFVDAVGSGLSEAIAPNTNQTFWGVDADAAVFRDFVLRYIAVNNRAASPKFLFGESYGTTRSAVLAQLLETAGVQVNGVILQSSILDYNANCAVVAPSPLSCGSYLPTYGATGAWFNLDHPNPTPADLPTFVRQMRTLAATQFDPAVAAFLATATIPDLGLLTQLANTTGLALGRWQTVVNVGPDYYQVNLIAGTLIGRYDTRVTAPINSALAREGDPSSTFIEGSFAAGITSYLASDLQYTNPSTYVTLSNAVNTWSFAHDGKALPDTVPDLAAAMAQNPGLKVLSLNGYHDLATPFFGTERDLARLEPNPNVETRFYVGGHMIYLDDGSRALEKADLVRFYQGALAGAH
jgi:carboxypeptidase C (cathepsin A)